MKKTILTLSAFILGAYLLWAGMLFSKKKKTVKQLPINATRNAKTLSSQKKNKLTSHEKIAYQKILAEALTFCPELEKVITNANKDKITDSHTFAHNIHFKKGNAIHRIRIFTEDAAEGSFEKLVYFVEDQDGFPQIRPIDNGNDNKKSVNPSEDYILSLLHGTQTIYDSQDVTYYLNTGKSFNISYENGKITKLTAAQVNCQI